MTTADAETGRVKRRYVGDISRTSSNLQVKIPTLGLLHTEAIGINSASMPVSIDIWYIFMGTRAQEFSKSALFVGGKFPILKA